MKFEDFLARQGYEQREKLSLETEVENLKAELEQVEETKRVLHLALYGSLPPINPSASKLPPQVQSLLGDLAEAEDEIASLERKVCELNLMLHQQRLHMKETTIQEFHKQKKLQRQPHLGHPESQLLSRSQHYGDLRKGKTRGGTMPDSDSEIPNNFSTTAGQAVGRDIFLEKPNDISEELLKCLIAVYLDLNKTPIDAASIVPRLTRSSSYSKGLRAITHSKQTKIPSYQLAPNLDPYGVVAEIDANSRDIGAYTNYIQIAKSSIDVGQLPKSPSLSSRLRNLMHKLSNVDVALLTNKQKLAFWLNIYNACIMNAFLKYGLPSSQDQLLDIVSKAEVEVGGTVINSSAIEHFILRHPKGQDNAEEAMVLRRAYGVVYPEPNITFALCRGSWSSPALRIYTANEVVNELGKAKVEYLEASVGVTSKRKILIPSLLQWHMHDFADGMESLVEWVYSQLPRSGTLKRTMMQCLCRQGQTPIARLVEIQRYRSDFRYLISL